MTDHKYPNEIASCHSMLKKRDAIILQLQAEHQPGIDNENLRKEFDTLQKTHDTCLEDKNTFYDEVKALQKELSTEVPTEDYENTINLLTKGNQELKNKIKLLEEKLALCNEHYIRYNNLKQKIAELTEDE